jgi:hypothetical protein
MHEGEATSPEGRIGGGGRDGSEGFMFRYEEGRYEESLEAKRFMAQSNPFGVTIH